MKVVKENKEKQRTVTLRIPEAIMVQLDKVADKNKVSRQSLISSVLKQVLNDKTFVLKIAE
jgi:predicted DNA binding CopG/RHH family protein